MYPLSTFATLYDNGGNSNYANSFVEGVDYFTNQNSAYIALSSTLWNNVTRIDTSPVSALTYINADGRVLSSLNTFIFNATNQPYLSSNNYYYYLNSGLISAVGYSGNQLNIWQGTSIVYLRDSSFNGSGVAFISGNSLEYFTLINCAVSSIVIPPWFNLTGFKRFTNSRTYLDPVSLSNFLVHLCTYAPANGTLEQFYERGYNDIPNTNNNPYKQLNESGKTAMNYLTSVKNWTYSFLPDPSPPPSKKNNLLVTSTNISTLSGPYNFISFNAPIGSDSTRGFWLNTKGAKLFFNSGTSVWFISGNSLDYFGLEATSDPWDVLTWVPNSGGTIPSVVKII